jgi:hypothetical protein
VEEKLFITFPPSLLSLQPTSPQTCHSSLSPHHLDPSNTLIGIMTQFFFKATQFSLLLMQVLQFFLFTFDFSSRITVFDFTFKELA